jgi:hypothetical protein
MLQAHAQLLGQLLSGLVEQTPQSQLLQADKIFIHSLLMAQIGMA